MLNLKYNEFLKRERKREREREKKKTDTPAQNFLPVRNFFSI